MGIKSIWDEWCENYPCRKVDKLYQPYDKNSGFELRLDAESFKEFVEITDERGGFEIVEFEGKFWVCYKEDEWR